MENKYITLGLFIKQQLMGKDQLSTKSIMAIFVSYYINMNIHAVIFK